MPRLQVKSLAALSALAVLLACQSLPASAQVAAAPGTQGLSTSADRTYAQMDQQHANVSALARPAMTEQKAGWGDVVISHNVGGCGLSCRAGHAD